eukprot:TRINITY_DN1305_c0_g1_i4.p1 TRINITY_DN1305_c0_g1~~TRINITY_DN1305_c0_g1_i4.p1  ORF type:complete len:107 (-),score=14.87 TRINITY_DN1305_c0_g1_i4:48-368(-)
MMERLLSVSHFRRMTEAVTWAVSSGHQSTPSASVLAVILLKVEKFFVREAEIVPLIENEKYRFYVRQVARYYAASQHNDEVKRLLNEADFCWPEYVYRQIVVPLVW